MKTKKPHIQAIHAQTVGSTAILPVVNSTESVSRIAVSILTAKIPKVNKLRAIRNDFPKKLKNGSILTPCWLK